LEPDAALAEDLLSKVMEVAKRAFHPEAVEAYPVGRGTDQGDSVPDQDSRTPQRHFQVRACSVADQQRDLRADFPMGDRVGLE